MTMCSNAFHFFLLDGQVGINSPKAMGKLCEGKHVAVIQCMHKYAIQVIISPIFAP